ncbi:WD repeat-containing protein jip5 [Coniosporium tulheliwenetii]|uniref:WD repeat-containing protein jip5 n=1 Tax=Coniosporium tulheliwenetii TaxID=3383036 RepID=A0ACC2Z8R1_9PEZI|nr:WD repeat-containing protein jip5 [Cladosporium sp. JES 115]
MATGWVAKTVGAFRPAKDKLYWTFAATLFDGFGPYFLAVGWWKVYTHLVLKTLPRTNDPLKDLPSTKQRRLCKAILWTSILLHYYGITRMYMYRNGQPIDTLRANYIRQHAPWLFLGTIIFALTKVVRFTYLTTFHPARRFNSRELNARIYLWLASMFDTVCSLPLTSDLFAQAIHPTEPLFAVGLAAGHVQTYRLPTVASDGSSDGDGQASDNGTGCVDTLWRTRRHKGSCRCLSWSHDGGALLSAGTDGLVKSADAMTATDSSALHLYDLRDHSFISQKPAQTHHPHDGYISSLTPLPPSAASTSGYSKQWVSTGGTTLAVTDLRRGVLVRSEDQEEELLSSCFVGGLPARGTSTGEKVLVGGGGGVLTLWEKGAWDDQDERIVVDREPGGGETLDVLTVLPENVGPSGKIVAVGMGNGRIRFVKIGPNKVVGEVWQEKIGEEDGEVNGVGKRSLGSDDEDGDEDGDGDSSEEEDKAQKPRKKRKRGKGKDRTGGKHVMSFKGLD